MRDLRAQFAPIAIVAFALLSHGCGKGSNGGSSGGSDYGERSLGPGVVADIESDGARAYLGTRGLFTPIGTLRGIDEDGEMAWELFAPDTIMDVMIGTNGLVYASTPTGTVAATKSGEWTPFDGARGGLLGWHPWGQPMAAPPSGGLVVMDDNGDILVQTLTDWIVRSVASHSDGAVYAFVEPKSDAIDTIPYLLKMNDRLEADWVVPIELDSMSTSRVELALAPDSVVVSWGNYTAAWSHAGDVLWAYENVPGSIVIDEDQTAYISGTRPTAVDAAGEVVWEQTSPALMTLTGSGLAAMVFEGDSIYQAPISTETGARDGGFLWTPMTDVFAPVAVGESTIAVGQQITGSSYFPESGGIVVEQGSETFVDAAGFGGGTDAIWPAADGVGGRRALPVAEVRPEEADMYGLWVAREGSRARAIELRTEAYDFGIADENAYGIYDYDVRQPPRLVEVGTWSYDGTNLSFAPQATVDDVSIAGSVEVHTGLPGTLKVDDPAQDIVRTFRRARRLPGSDALFAGADTLGWLYGEGALDNDNGVAIVPDGNGGATVVSQFSYIGRIGGETYVVDRAAGGGEDDVSDNLIFGVTADGEITGARHNKTPGPTTMSALDTTADGTRVYGPFTVGGDTQQVESAQIQVGGGTVGISGEQPWGGPEPSTAEIMPATPWKGGALYAGVDYADSQDGVGFVLRVDDEGQVMWENAMGNRVYAAAGLTGGDVVILGQFAGIVDVGSTTLVGNTSLYLARLDGETGEPIDGYRIAGRIVGVETSLTALPDGGVLLDARASAPYNAGSGGVFAAQNFNPAVFSAFGPELEPRWTRSFTPDPEVGFGVDSNVVAVDPYGMITVGGQLSGDYAYEGVAAGRENRTTALWQFDPCGSLVWQRRFNTGVSVQDVAFGEDGTIYATGGFAGDLFVPPWVALHSGGTPDVGSGFAGGSDTLVFTVEGSGDRYGESLDCRSEPPSTSIVKIDPRGFGSGRVTSEPAGIDCPGDCEAEFSDLTEVTLTAEADDGSSFDAFQAAGCDGRDCRLLVADDVIVDAWFDASTVDWAVSVPNVATSDLQVVTKGEHAAIAFLYRGQPVQIGTDTYPPNVGVGVARVGADGSVEVQEVAGSRSTNLLTGFDVDADGAVALSGSSTLLPDSAGNNAAIVVMNEDGSERWSRAIQTSNLSASIQVAFGDGVIAAHLPANGEITVDDQTVTAPLGALALFDSANGDLIALLGINGQVRALFAEAGAIVVQGDGGLSEEVVPGFTPPSSGRWYVRFDDGNLDVVDALGWRSQFDMPLSFFADSENGSQTIYGWDENLRPAWAGVPGLNTGFLHPYVPDPDGGWLGNVAIGAARGLSRPDRDARFSIVRLDPSGRPVAGWPTPEGDELAVASLAAAGDRALAVVRSTASRGPDGEPIESFDEPTTMIVSVRIGGAQ